MTTHHSGKRSHKYGRRYTRDAVGTLHVPHIDPLDGPCEICGHVETLIKTAATKNQYLCSACRPFVIDDDVKAPLSTRAKQPQFSRWKRRAK